MNRLVRQNLSSGAQLDHSVRKDCVCGLLEKMVGTTQGSLEYKQISSS